jgi:hypothetical protein
MGIATKSDERPISLLHPSYSSDRARSRKVETFRTSLDLTGTVDHDFFTAGTGTPGIFTLKEPRLVRVQKKTVFQSSPPKATLAVF